MKIAICGSIAIHPKMIILQSELEAMGHEVQIPPGEINDEAGNKIPVMDYYKLRQNMKDNDSWVWDRKQELIIRHFEKIAWSDAVLIANYDKKGVDGYIGGNTLMELGVALWLKKKIFLLKPIPDLGYKEEILATKPVVINGDLSLIRE